MKNYRFEVYKKKLKNGLTILVRPTKSIPEVTTHIWYGVGSKHEGVGERGMAHALEHMMFKGTKKLSERDIDLITHKLSGYTNAFTAHDYTSYVFTFPSNVWAASLKIFADCMHNTRFDEGMLASELQAIIQELKLYTDDYQEVLVEKMLAAIFPEHPYHNPIIGYKNDLYTITNDKLKSFYHKYYQPNNATIVIVGDIDKDHAFDQVEKYFGRMPAGKAFEQSPRFVNDDVAHADVTLYREVENPWALYAYKMPGFSSQQNHLFDMISFLVGDGRSSRLYEKLVNELKLASAAGSFVYDLFEQGMFFIYAQPAQLDMLPAIEQVIQKELDALIHGPIKDWEMMSIKKRSLMDYYNLLESNTRQAELIGSSYLATGDEHYLDTYIDAIECTQKSEIQDALSQYCKPALQYTGYLLPAGEQEKAQWMAIQQKIDAFDQTMAKNHERTSTVEEIKLAPLIKEKKLPSFTYPLPKTFTLSNGIEVIYHHNPQVPQISLLLGLKADYLYENEENAGISTFTSRLLLEGTKKRSGKELNQFLESHGMFLSATSGVVGMQFLKQDFATALDVLSEIITLPEFSNDAIKKIRLQTTTELHEYWDTPIAFVDTLARGLVYGSHPYANERLGSLDSVKSITKKQISSYFDRFITPKGAMLILVGDLSDTNPQKLKELLEKHLGSWVGRDVENLVFPQISFKNAQKIVHEIDRDQVVLAFAAPSISRLDKNFDIMALLDVVLVGGELSMNSRLFELRQQSGLFYTIGGSLVYGSGREPGMMYVKTLVSVDKVAQAERMIKKVIKTLGEKGAGLDEIKSAANLLISASVRLFESNMQMATTFFFLKKCGLAIDLFDKHGANLSILNLDVVNTVARNYLGKKDNFSTIQVGRRAQ